MVRFLTTASAAPDLRADYWTEMLCNTYVALDCDVAHPKGFDGAIVMQRLPGLELSIVSAGAQRWWRRPCHIARARDEFFLVSVQASGQVLLRQNGRTAVLGPGDFALCDSTRAYELHFEDHFQQLVLKIPGEALRQAVRGPEKLTARTVSGASGAGQLMLGFLQDLWHHIDALNPASAVAVAGGVLSMLAAGLQTLPSDDSPCIPSLATYHLARIKRLIEMRLRDPCLCISDVARELGLSIGHIHRLFKNESATPTQYIWNRRLEACSRDLLDPGCANHSISEIAFNWGFNDAAHFSRAFRLRFNCSPREWRLSAGRQIPSEKMSQVLR